jgi:hypothetical protein
MGKIVVSENVTLDGVVEDPAGAEGFGRGGWVGRVGERGREKAAEVLLDEGLGAEAQLLGRRTYEFLAARWPSRSGELADRLNDMPKYFLPTFLVEGSYEDEQNVSTVPPGTPQQLRRQEYWSLLSGATGQLFGNHSTWQFLCSQRDADGNCVGGWKDELASPGATQMANLVALFGSRPWYQLVPDQNHTVVTSGYGTFGDDDYVTAASTPDGKLAVAYVPSSSRAITVDLGTFSGPVTARWYDPTDGAFTTIGDGPFANDGSVTLGAPPTNAAGDNDWVLVLEVS